MNRITLAAREDKEEILALYKTMLYGPADWNEHYPNEDTIDFDMSRNALYVMKNELDEIIAAISIDEDEEVDKLPCWSIMPGGELSRLCVRKDMQNHGIAKEMMRYAFDVLKNEGKNGVHILVRTGHTKALSTYAKLGFKTVGECHLFDKDFICMEIKL
ncbi:MAG: GNAT family N-acetyltransferase [Oscillospiraceae bacterium]|nr:GNAT family N-acetyltransferase [Oscillospiraceae bacterium]MCI7499544.1 GNAT family N-acetyltransferase [Oscillospiraceae bacterium]MDD7279484.1 GNAT family N-acetyltransferase [Oscillospiraceae bacterium]MDY2864810.1 GNAT family N-acetyltransferase [Oscillospiraceae bacterium]